MRGLFPVISRIPGTRSEQWPLGYAISNYDMPKSMTLEDTCTIFPKNLDRI